MSRTATPGPVERVHRNGDLTIRAERKSVGVVRLPRDYVESAVELAYATTAARAQGRTVDTTHVLVDEAMTREALYVAATRGRVGTHLYVESEQLLGLNAERPPAPMVDTMDQVAAVLHRENGERTATEVQREARARAADENPRRRPAPTAGRAHTTPRRTPTRQL